MTRTLTRPDLERLRVAISEQLGFFFGDDQLEQLGQAAGTRQTALGITGIDRYLERLRAPGLRGEEICQLAELLTVTETFFYRNAEQLRAFVEAALPAAALRRGRRLRILSAGCASGEEPYSLAIALREALPDVDAWDIEILGIDVNPAMLEKAERADYTPWSLRSTPAPIRARYFTEVGKTITLVPSVKQMVRFRRHNLADNDAIFFRALACDAVFCRNVIMYFMPEVQERVVARLTDALVPGGHLFLGHAETLRGLSHAFHLCHTHGTFYYQRREDSAERPPFPSPRVPAPPVELEVLPRVVEDATSWFDAIQRATERVRELTKGGPPEARPGGATAPLPAPRARRSDLSEILALMQAERFAEAEARLAALPVESGEQADALLFSAVLLTNAGRITEAEVACGKLLAVDELHAGAHYLKALCREHAGDPAGAVEHDHIAVHLDPTFAMAHLHAGLMAKRGGDPLVARRELGQALLLLEREDTSRLALFGGGFSRDALTSLCRAELGKLGGTR